MSQIQKLSYVFILTSTMTDAVLAVCSRAPEKNRFVCIHAQGLCVCVIYSFKSIVWGAGNTPQKSVLWVLMTPDFSLRQTIQC